MGRALVAALLVLGCMFAGDTATTIESSHLTGSALPAPVDELPVPIAGESIRHRITVARRRFEQAARRVGRMDGTRRFAHWLPVQFRLMPPTWRGPTVLRL